MFIITDGVKDMASAAPLANDTVIEEGGFPKPVQVTPFAEVSNLLNGAVEDQVFPGAVLLIGKNGQILFNQAVGQRTLSPKASGDTSMSLSTVFDIAEVTRVVVTSTLLMLFTENNRIRLDDKISRYLQGFGIFGKGEMSVAHLLAHTSGLPQSVDFFEELNKLNSGSRAGILASRAAKDFVYREIGQTKTKFTPGLKRLTSDVGFIVLGQLIETLTGLKLDHAAQRFIFQPLGISSSSFVDLALIRRRGILPIEELIAPTEDCSWRGRILCGEVHDENAWAMGGISGHAGLFASASDLHKFASALIQSYSRGGYLKQNTVRTFFSANAPEGTFPEDERWALGWDNPSKENGMIDSRLSAQAVGMNGFSGCSLWLEPEKGIDIILLSNRIHPNRNNKKIQNFRIQLLDAILEAVA